MPQLGEVGGEQPVGYRLAVDEDAVVVEDDEVIAHTAEHKRRKGPRHPAWAFPEELFGGVLLSHRVPPAVPSAL
ncbi:hypothetical protein GCM10014715_48340 [Streptomyces spiralis]|uniref:Uncharacterized protein n=1 Tax=Streptomyces spiralis TaxID=66376 RepID=A0A919A3Y7_9ACTN|nr:hypothetical protein GCM10014715_48340 [Streptomyces spiralis]